MQRDSFYTPEILADKLLSYLGNEREFQNVVDFCVGDGELLRAAHKRWPKIQCFGSDISFDAIKRTKERHPTWLLSNFDFLKPRSIKSSKLFRNKKDFDLILLNPPFSCWGGTLNHSVLNGLNFSSSTSIKFILEALKFLSPCGVIYAILPLSVAYSQKDKKVWTFLKEKYNLTVLEETSTKYFKNCTPNIILVSLNDYNQTGMSKLSIRSDNNIFKLEVFRGKLSIFKKEMYLGSIYLIHTTNLKNNRIQGLVTRVNYESSVIKGPAVLIPRVGKPDVSKVCIINSDDEYCLSDCIFAIKCESENLSYTIFSLLVNKWDVFSQLYRGTGAHYITKDKIEYFLNLDIYYSPILNSINTSIGPDKEFSETPYIKNNSVDNSLSQCVNYKAVFEESYLDN